MDSLRGKFGLSDGLDDDAGWDDDEHDGELAVDDSPPTPVGQDERRMQVRAYNFWASLLGERTYPSIEDIEPDSLPEFADNSVLLDFTAGVENPAIAYLGKRLGAECGNERAIETLADVPSRSLLSRITDHYMQILANQAPVGFEAEFINDRGLTILYRGILRPFSTDDDTIDFIYGVINWKEVADQLTTDELLLEIDQALNPSTDEDDDGYDSDDPPLPEPEVRLMARTSITRWADGPGGRDAAARGDRAALPTPSFARLDAHLGPETAGEPGFGCVGIDDAVVDDEEDDDADSRFDPLADLKRPQPDTHLHQCLAEARALADAAQGAEVRSRTALYDAVGRAYDVSLAARKEPESFARLLEDHAIASTQRAPMTPVVKLVFGADYDRSRIAEYAAVLAYAQRTGVGRGDLADLLDKTEGGLKEIVARERAERRASKGTGPVGRTRRVRTEARLSKLDGQPLSRIPGEGAAYSLGLIRRQDNGEIAYLGEVAGDDRLLERAAKHLLS